MDGASQARHAAALAVHAVTWLRDEEAAGIKSGRPEQSFTRSPIISFFSVSRVARWFPKSGLFERVARLGRCCRLFWRRGCRQPLC